MVGRLWRWNLSVTFVVSRRDALKGAATMLMTGAICPKRAAAKLSLEPVAPERVGFAPDLPQRFAALQDAGRLLNVHGVVALRKGQLVFERYMSGTDESRGSPPGTAYFKPDTLHDMQSVTKSIVGLLYGIALGQRRVPAPDQPLRAQFPEYPDIARDSDKARLTIAHALTMTLGLAWNEDDPLHHSDEVLMDDAPDRYRFVLERPMLGPPGKGYRYNGGATTLLGRLIERRPRR